MFFTAWILGGVISICGALTFAEIGSRFPTAGGFYKIFSHCYHPAYAFMLNWSLVIVNAASAVGVVIVGAEYINPILLPQSLQNDVGIKLTAASVILIDSLWPQLPRHKNGRTNAKCIKRNKNSDDTCFLPGRFW